MAITHLKIEQASTGENVSAALIEKLAEVAHGNLDAESNLSGVLNANKAYRDSCEFLVNKFSPNLGINVPQGNHYIRFADDKVKNICKDQWGDGVGITESQADAITTFGSAFNNSSIEEFDELSFFSNVTTLRYTGHYSSEQGTFAACTNLRHIDLRHIDIMEPCAFQSDANLEEVKNFNGYYFQYVSHGRQFAWCHKLHTINLSNLEIIPDEAFVDNYKLKNIGDLKSVRYISHAAFNMCQELDIIVDMPKLGVNDSRIGDISSWLYFRKLNNTTFAGSGIIGIKDLGVITQINDGQNYNNYVSPKWNMGTFSHCASLRFAILPDTLTYIGTYAFWGDTALEYVKVLATTPPTLGENDPTNNAHPFYNCTCKFYVPNGTLSAYQAASGWDALCQAGRVFEMSQFATDFPND